MFKNVMVYRLQSPWTTSQADLEDALQANRFAECGASQEKSVGWVEPRGHAHGPLVEVVGGQWIMKLQIEVKSVPSSVVKRKVQDEVDRIEAQTGRKPGKKERRDLTDDARQALLPMAFSKIGSTWVWLNPQENLLVLDCGSTARADEVMTALIKAAGGLSVALINTQTSPVAAMAHWLREREAPQHFSVDRECELKAADESKSVVRYTRHALDTDEVVQHVVQGKLPTRLALTWNERVSFVLTEGLQLKKLAILDVVLEENSGAAGDRKDDNFDADIAIATGEIQPLIDDLLDALDGEVPLGQAPATAKD